eukprot:TRINITY_DN965_c0_g1_i15.p1 TRINITY_DN965_c0_g1~~TRINITY_DN965_c0_g1_i15.p1  ORF type:complete len:836 (+),score=142.68 TRINITY_DN965_c0_g1_i15:47-2554(+)
MRRIENLEQQEAETSQSDFLSFPTPRRVGDQYFLNIQRHQTNTHAADLRRASRKLRRDHQSDKDKDSIQEKSLEKKFYSHRYLDNDVEFEYAKRIALKNHRACKIMFMISAVFFGYMSFTWKSERGIRFWATSANYLFVCIFLIGCLLTSLKTHTFERVFHRMQQLCYVIISSSLIMQRMPDATAANTGMNIFTVYIFSAIVRSLFLEITAISTAANIVLLIVTLYFESAFVVFKVIVPYTLVTLSAILLHKELDSRDRATFEAQLVLLKNQRSLAEEKGKAAKVLQVHLPRSLSHRLQEGGDGREVVYFTKKGISIWIKWILMDWVPSHRFKTIYTIQGTIHDRILSVFESHKIQRVQVLGQFIEGFMESSDFHHSIDNVELQRKVQQNLKEIEFYMKEMHINIEFVFALESGPLWYGTISRTNQIGFEVFGQACEIGFQNLVMRSNGMKIFTMTSSSSWISSGLRFGRIASIEPQVHSNLIEMSNMALDYESNVVQKYSPENYRTADNQEEDHDINPSLHCHTVMKDSYKPIFGIIPRFRFSIVEEGEYQSEIKSGFYAKLSRKIVLIFVSSSLLMGIAATYDCYQGIIHCNEEIFTMSVTQWMLLFPILLALGLTYRYESLFNFQFIENLNTSSAEILLGTYYSFLIAKLFLFSGQKVDYEEKYYMGFTFYFQEFELLFIISGCCISMSYEFRTRVIGAHNIFLAGFIFMFGSSIGVTGAFGALHVTLMYAIFPTLIFLVGLSFQEKTTRLEFLFQKALKKKAKELEKQHRETICALSCVIPKNLADNLSSAGSNHGKAYDNCVILCLNLLDMLSAYDEKVFDWISSGGFFY